MDYYTLYKRVEKGPFGTIYPDTASLQRPKAPKGEQFLYCLKLIPEKKLFIDQDLWWMFLKLGMEVAEDNFSYFLRLTSFGAPNTQSV